MRSRISLKAEGHGLRTDEAGDVQRKRGPQNGGNSVEDLLGTPLRVSLQPVFSLRPFLIALQFLTIIPVKVKGDVSERDIARSASAFVIVGVLQGLLLIISDYVFSTLFHHELVILLVLLVAVLSNGGFHLDGLSDTLDALSVKSSGDTNADRQKRLLVMKDPTVGPAGVTAIIFSLGLKYLALKNLSHLTPFIYYSSLLMMPVLSKWTMVISIFYGKAARHDGLGKIFLDGVGLKEVIISTTTTVVLILTVLSLFGHYSRYIFYAALMVAMYILCRLLIVFSNKKFGGITGDVLGAISEFTEVSFLMSAIIWSGLFI